MAATVAGLWQGPLTIMMLTNTADPKPNNKVVLWFGIGTMPPFGSTAHYIKLQQHRIHFSAHMLY